MAWQSIRTSMACTVKCVSSVPISLSTANTARALKADDVVDGLELFAGLGALAGGDDDEDEVEEDGEDAEADDDDDVDADETPLAMKRRLRAQQAARKAEEKEQTRDKRNVKHAQHALDKGSTAGAKGMKGVMAEVIKLLEEALDDAAKHYKCFLCDVLTETLMKVRRLSLQ